MSISYTRHNKISEKNHEVKLCGGGGGARGAYLAHGLGFIGFQIAVVGEVQGLPMGIMHGNKAPAIKQVPYVL